MDEAVANFISTREHRQAAYQADAAADVDVHTILSALRAAKWRIDDNVGTVSGVHGGGGVCACVFTKSGLPRAHVFLCVQAPVSPS